MTDMVVQLLRQISPGAALHAAWIQTDPETPSAIGLTGLAAWLADLNWAVIVSVLALTALSFGGVLIQLHKQWVLAGLEVEAARAKYREPTPARRDAPRPEYLRTVDQIVPDTRSSG